MEEHTYITLLCFQGAKSNYGKIFIHSHKYFLTFAEYKLCATELKLFCLDGIFEPFETVFVYNKLTF